MHGVQEGLIVPPVTLASGRCALCWESFRVGDQYATLWPKAGGTFALNVHQGCRAQLDAGDVTLLFAAMESRLKVAIAALKQGRTPPNGVLDIAHMGGRG